MYSNKIERVCIIKCILVSRRSIGLGLALCKSIIGVHNGEIFVKDNVPSGAIFTFTLPIGEIEINE